MFNVTIIKVKDIIKYALKISIIIVTLLYIKELINSRKIELKISDVNVSKSLQKVVDENMPIITQTNDNKESDNIDFLKYILENQMNISKHLKIKENDEEIENKEKTLDNSITVEKAKTGLETQILTSNVPDSYTNLYNGVEIKNDSDIEITDDMLNFDISINNKNMIIFHTHTCESYTPTENFNYEESGTFRTTDLNCNVVRVGDELTKQLNSYNYNVIHDKTYHDYPAYNGSYGRSLETIENILETNNNVDVIIDLHRDAIGDFDYAPTVKIGEEEAARLMFVIGTNGGGLEHPNWNQNLKFAINMQEKANELYPGLFRPIIVRNSRYNQHLSKAACIIEVGATGNTMEQCLTSMKYLAKVLNEVIK